MDGKSVRHKNNRIYLCLGIILLALAAFHFFTGDRSVSFLYAAAGVMFLLPILLKGLAAKKDGGPDAGTDRKN